MPRYCVESKTVFVTGAAGGIGAASAKALHARGANVVLTGRNPDSLARLAESLGPARTLAMSVDVTDGHALAEAVDRTVDRFGSLDIVFANAGIPPNPPATVATIDPDDFERIVETNLLGVWRTVRAALPAVTAARGHVLITSSLYAHLNGVLNAPYAASKAGVEQFARALRTELRVHHTTVGILNPGWVDTPLTTCVFGGHPVATRMLATILPRPLRTAISPQAVARRVVTGIENRSSSINVPRRFAPISAFRGVIAPLGDQCLNRYTTLQTLLAQAENTPSPTRRPPNRHRRVP
ncbi:short-chain dehydrogenase/reductase [Embleya sp. NPDC020630]|uniref:short-chain dehydrogenase/reductase n=1 Tax=Embleya sp. NPDC020630 TaxID=3363979 RepID=UPI00379A7BAB